MKLQFISRTKLIDYYLELINDGVTLNEEQYQLLCELSKD